MKEVTALAFFGQNGEFHSLTDLRGKRYYNLRELMKVVSPIIPYGRYVMKNITLIVDETTLMFFHRNIDAGLTARLPRTLPVTA